MANSNIEDNKRGANKTKRPHRRTNSGLHGGKPPFVATADQKRMVMALAGLRMSWDEMRILHGAVAAPDRARLDGRKTARKQECERDPAQYGGAACAD